MEPRGRQEALVKKLRQALEMHTEGVSMMRLSLQRRHKSASSEEIDRLMGDWLCSRPGAANGDAVGRLRLGEVIEEFNDGT